MTDHYFDGIIDEIKNKNHPEIYHFRKGNHPGPKWYLKTVCPTPNLNQIDKFKYGLLWANLAQQYTDKIKLVAHAYDWSGNEIPYMISVWINIDFDVIFTLDSDNGFDIVLVDRSTGRDYYRNNLKQLIEISRDEMKDQESPPVATMLDELDQIEKIVDVINQEINFDNAQHIRKQFEILNGDKDD